MKERWREYFKNLMNVKDGGLAIITAVALNGGGEGVYREQSTMGSQCANRTLHEV